MNTNLAKYIDHTLLKPESTKKQIDKIIEEAIQYEFASVCINPTWVAHCYERLKNTSVKVCTVIGFPLGATSTETKVFETMQAIKDGATEVDMVINIGELKSGNLEKVKNDIVAVVQATKGDALTKVIIETSLLTDEEKITACKLAKEAGANYVKTSTGFSNGGATIEDIRLMRETVGPDMGVKASGGVRDLQTMKAMIEAGATRIGASAGVEILKGNEGVDGY
ncbi:deoxyribose-phosphate aldolase [Oceanobacillus caeni]|uniref:deoxyribose-phosphate aldolase n=1 Tax=Oceanobacillus caeni TaxID=405946 RepID=UPI000621CCB5|nr:deoxyribose-phosphate aldolase [Oceanobacillus caeni]KKE80596.1 deoxyribose-phosphate aldolase [Bacilli bacterium VT-13-104]PZD87839.1 deoxyribose-phosphate aldolase [Bacilli bacterium]MBU8789470.1 deoxyribose-phosphate aldolase [Oceanobacillus caeni]MCR1833882.1 deoxyribose-phosphate aldolase [Oceanobacillus caeni]PZD88993.1 deoxyribose-phosphate aldolase [Bacilli bacterium]